MTKVGDLVARTVEQGVYELRLVKMNSETPSKAGDDMLTLVWEEIESGIQVYDRLVVKPSVLFKWAQLFIALGGDPNTDVDQDDMASFAEDCSRIIAESETVFARLVLKEYNGVKKNEISMYVTRDAAEEMQLNEEVPF